MFDIDKWNEIFITISKNKLRTFLTAFSVAWGIFMLMILLGFGTGMSHGIEYDFKEDAINSIWVFPGQTSKPYKGMKPGRNVIFHNEDVKNARRNSPQVDHATGQFYAWGEYTVRYKKKYASYNMRGVDPDFQFIENHIVDKGRYINQLDIAQRRKVAVIGSKVEEGLYEPNEDPIGTWIDVGNIKYRVVGVYKDTGGEGEMRRIFVPITTAQLAYNGQNRIHSMMFTVGDASAKESEKIADKILNDLATKYKFDPEDARALHIWNAMEEYQRFANLMVGIKFFLWIVGIGTIIAGIVGVSNIMLIIIKDRTREIGIRKALGATPASIVGLFLQEAIFITMVAGYIGLISGIGLLEFIKWALIEFEVDAPYFKDPEINLSTAVGATILLVIAGAVAGYMPAHKAAKVNPIVALREE